MPVSINVADTIFGFDLLAGRIDRATRDIASDALKLFQLAGMKEAPVGTPGNTTNPPGDLSRSIDVDGPSGGSGVYTGQVGPTTIYGRQRELGGDIYPKNVLHGTYTKFGTQYSYGPGFGKGYVHQEGDHYMLRAYGATLPAVKIMADARVVAAVAGVN